MKTSTKLGLLALTAGLGLLAGAYGARWWGTDEHGSDSSFSEPAPADTAHDASLADLSESITSSRDAEQP